jgi:ParB/RepB/Spo0J family partition protein
MAIVDLNLAALDDRYGRLRVKDQRRETQLMASLDEHGQQDAIMVVAEAEGRYAVVDGHKRVRALRRLRRDTVRAVVWEASAPEALAAAYRSASKQSYSAIEDGWLVYELHRVGRWDLGKTAAALGRSKSWASRRLGLVEELPDCLAEAIAAGRVGAHAAATYLTPLTRVNGQDGRQLAEKVLCLGLSDRQLKALCASYKAAGAPTRRKIADDPARFLKALEVAGKGPQDPALSDAENRALKALELIGNVALGLTRSLPQVLGYDAGNEGRAALWPAWERAAKRLALLEETAAALKAAREKNKEDENAQSRSAYGDPGAASAGPRQPQDRQGPWDKPHSGAGSDSQRQLAGVAAADQASPA